MSKTQVKEINLTTNEALVLQQVYEDGGDGADSLAAQMGMPRRTVMNVLTDQAYGDAWVRLTTRGKQLVQRIWPEAQAMAV